MTTQQPTFRGRAIETSEWEYGFGWHKTEDGALLYTDNGTILCHIETMGQSTNQRDDDNIELFAGDICIVTPMLAENSSSYKVEIVWDKARFAFYRLEEDVAFSTLPLYNFFDTFGLSVKKISTVHDVKQDV